MLRDEEQAVVRRYPLNRTANATDDRDAANIAGEQSNQRGNHYAIR